MDIECLFLRRLNIDLKLVYFYLNDLKKKYKIVIIILFLSFEKFLKKKKIFINYICINKFYVKLDIRFLIKENIWDMGFLGN